MSPVDDATFSKLAEAARQFTSGLGRVNADIKRAESILRNGFAPRLWIEVREGAALGWDVDRSGMRIMYEDANTSRRPLIETKGEIRAGIGPKLAELLNAISDRALADTKEAKVCNYCGEPAAKPNSKRCMACFHREHGATRDTKEREP